jgi:hypothetical protein
LEIAEGNLPDKQAPAAGMFPVGVLAGEDVAADAVADAVQKQHQRCPQSSVSYAGKWAANLQHAPKGTRPHKKTMWTGKLSATILNCHLKRFRNFWEL